MPKNRASDSDREIREYQIELWGNTIRFRLNIEMAYVQKLAEAIVDKQSDEQIISII